MNRKWLAAAACMTVAWGAVPAVAAGGSEPVTGCSSGAHTLSHLGDHVFGYQIVARDFVLERNKPLAHKAANGRQQLFASF